MPGLVGEVGLCGGGCGGRGRRGGARGAEGAPTAVVVAAARDRLAALDPMLARWNAIVTQELPGLNRRLQAAGLGALQP